jgi:hypothetical protein
MCRYNNFYLTIFGFNIFSDGIKIKGTVIEIFYPPFVTTGLTNFFLPFTSDCIYPQFIKKNGSYFIVYTIWECMLHGWCMVLS